MVVRDVHYKSCNMMMIWKMMDANIFGALGVSLGAVIVSSGVLRLPPPLLITPSHAGGEGRVL